MRIAILLPLFEPITQSSFDNTAQAQQFIEEYVVEWCARVVTT